MSLLEKYLVQCEEIADHEQQLKESEYSGQTELALDAQSEEVKTLWAEWRELYKSCLADSDICKKNKEILRTSKKKVHDSYINCLTIIGNWKEKLKVVPTITQQKSSSSVSVPPCDTEIFHGDYISWPSFRDLFTAIYVNNKKLSPVEKLYHLFQKTSGEAREINRNIPLTAEGFTIAWDNLRNQYENKRILINSQLRALFNLAQCPQESANGLKKLQRDITNCISVLELYKIDIDSWGPIFVYQCTSKMPKLTLSLWEQSLVKKTEIPHWEDLNKFLTERYQALESISDMVGSNGANLSQISRPRYNQFDKSRQLKVHHTKVKDHKCTLCKNSHPLKACPKFLSMDFENRLSVIKREKRCLNCLAPGHRSADCQSSSCLKCSKKHNTLLHKDQLNKQENIKTVSASNLAQNFQHQSLQSTNTNSGNVRAYHTSVLNNTMLATAWLNILKDGISYKVRALIDPCSDDTFISSRIQKLLKIPTKPISAEISGLGGERLAKCSKVAMLTIGSINMPSFSVDTDALVISDVTGNIPTHSFESSVADQLPNLKFADPTFYKTGPVDILLGANLYPLILLNGVRHGILGSLIAQETVFGWILTGPTNKLTPRRESRISHCTRVSISEQLTRFWEIEEVSKKPIITEDDRICEQIYQSTTVRTSEGRYMVDLPFKSNSTLNVAIRSNRYIALSQFLRNEKSLSRKAELKREYDKVVSEYLTLGHMEKIHSPLNSSDSCFYLPHHGIFKPESTTTKLRVVFNASCPSANGKSLNDALYIGPALQKDITSLILNWRLYKFVFNADISKMYRQILINPKHASYQRILFRTSADREVEDFQLKTVTFGVNCAPYLALRTLLKLAEDERIRFPIGSKILEEDMYVDDALVGAHTLTEGLIAKTQLISILSSGGFELRKWTANSKELLKDLPRDHLLNEEFLEFDDKSSSKTLGIRWNASSDLFYFATEKIPNRNSYTKREVLSVIAKLFDPLGWLSPVVVCAKILMQQLWLDEIGWDDSLKPLTLEKWKTFVSNYSKIDDICIPRWVQYSPECKFELHGFCDSSELAYAANLYLRVEVDNKVYTSLLVAKSKVAPIKKVSLPRLELCGALLLANLADSVLPQLKIHKPALWPWTDSTIVLAWLRKPSHNWTTFVGNRVAIIHEKIGSDWNHVPTSVNPADLATRGLTPLELKESSLWWYGPPWLKESSDNWPSKMQIAETNLESKPTRVLVARSDNFDDILERFSCLSRAIRVVAYILRFWKRTHPNSNKTRYGDLSLQADELALARNRLIQMSQRIYFSDEYNRLSTNQRLDSRSSLLTLTPFLDSDQIIRANGRLSSTSYLSFSERHPFILAYRSRLAQLYVDRVHRLTHHGGIQLTLATVRLECWIIRARVLIKTRIHKCLKCVLAQKKRQGQIMASLPTERTSISRPFTNTGVDFAGPFDIKTFNGRGCRISKGYICLFVCFATKAVHLEPVSDLSTLAFMAALARFASRRGCPNRIYSDNGRNFVGASKELKVNFSKVVSNLKDEAIAKYSPKNLQWHFIPAAAPHMGGLWEAGVKSCKTHLKKISGQIRHTFEEFATILATIEACMNSRPLTPLSDNPDDLCSLTPGHFLIGSSLFGLAEPEEVPTKVALLNRWRRLKIVQQEFCRRWKLEYLKELHKRSKWKRDQENLQLNDLVVLRSDSLCPTDWRLGRVLKLYLGTDNRVRVVDLKTQSGIITRPVHKLVLLPRAM